MIASGKAILGTVLVGGLLWGTVALARKKGTGGGDSPSKDPVFDPPGGGGGGGSGGGGGGGSGGGGSGGGGGGSGGGGSGGGGGGDGGGGGGGSGGGGSGGGGQVIDTPTRVIGGKGAGKGGFVFGNLTDKQVPKDFNGNSNRVRFSNDCGVVLVGRRLWENGTGTLNCEEPADGELMTALEHGQNLCAFIDYLMNQAGIVDTAEILSRIIAGLKPPCLEQHTSDWTPAMKSFVNWISPLVAEYVVEAGGSNPNPEIIHLN